MLNSYQLQEWVSANIEDSKMKASVELVEAIIKLHSIASLVEHYAGATEIAHSIRECADRLDKFLEEHHDIQQDKGTEGSGP